MKLIAGLGNPTEKYAGTRHNMGFMVIDEMAKRLFIDVDKRMKKAEVGMGTYRGEKILLAKPQTFMNLSGESIQPLMDFYKIPPEDILVIVDDINLAPGNLRIRGAGSAGGHNGLKSIISCLGTEGFARLRLGVGAKTGNDLADYVLGHFTKEEQPLIREAVELAADAALLFVTDGVEEAMNRYNGYRKKEANGDVI